jgi:hypothetical protein
VRSCAGDLSIPRGAVAVFDSQLKRKENERHVNAESVRRADGSIEPPSALNPCGAW